MPPIFSRWVKYETGWWFGTFLIFPYIKGIIIIPIDVHIFQKGGPTTNQEMFANEIHLFSGHRMLHRAAFCPDLFLVDLSLRFLSKKKSSMR